MLTEFFRSVVDFYMTHIGYGMVILLMTVESSFIPFPSEIVIPPAAWKAAEGDLNLALVILSGLLGSLLGALFNYYFALYLGRAVLYKFADSRFAHFMLLDRAGVEKAEEYFRKHGRSSTFVGRFIPAIRQLISLPAGLSRMDMKPFLLYTALGSGIWTAILAFLGYHLYSRKELLEEYYTEISYVTVGLGILFAAYLVWNGLKKGKSPS